MHRRHPLPKLWLFTDERIGDLLGAIRSLPHASGIVFRHYSLGRVERRKLFNDVKRLALRAGHVVLLAGTPGQARHWRADGAYHRSKLASLGLRGVGVHDRAELVTALRIRADLVFISPLFKTRSHPDANPLGRSRLGLLAEKHRSMVVALGGIDQRRARSLTALRLHGWAGIDAFTSVRT